MKSKQRGFTLFELLMLVWFLVAFSMAGGLIYVALHFISKYW